MRILPHYQYHQHGTFLPRINLYQHIIITQSPESNLGFTLGVVYSIGFDKYIKTYSHHYNIQRIFIALKILGALPIHRLSPYNHSSFYYLHSRVFSKMSQYKALSDWLHSLSNMHSRFLHVFSGLIAHFFLALNCLGLPQFIYPFTYWRMPWLLPSFGN